MTDSTAKPRRPSARHPGALVLTALACCSPALFVLLHRAPLPEETIALATSDLAANWAPHPEPGSRP